jgi:hypothetical protein
MIPTDTTLEQASSEDVEYLCETDRLSLSNSQLTKNTFSAEKDTLREDGYERVSGEGMYAISVTGEVSFDTAVFKHAYVSYASEPTLSTPEAVIRRSVRDGLGPAFASIIHDAAEAAGYRTPREKVNYAVKAIQAFPYVPDDVALLKSLRTDRIGVRDTEEASHRPRQRHRTIYIPPVLPFQ